MREYLATENCEGQPKIGILDEMGSWKESAE